MKVDHPWPMESETFWRRGGHVSIQRWKTVIRVFNYLTCSGREHDAVLQFANGNECRRKYLRIVKQARRHIR